MKKGLVIFFILFISLPKISLAQTEDFNINQNSKAQVFELFNEFFIGIEKTRIENANFFSYKRDFYKKKIGINGHSNFVNGGAFVLDLNTDELKRNDKIGIDNPLDYLSYTFFISLTKLFSSKFLFYSSISLISMLIAKFISNITIRWYNR